MIALCRSGSRRSLTSSWTASWSWMYQAVCLSGRPSIVPPSRSFSCRTTPGTDGMNSGLSPWAVQKSLHPKRTISVLPGSTLTTNSVVQNRWGTSLSASLRRAVHMASVSLMASVFWAPTSSRMKDCPSHARSGSLFPARLLSHLSTSFCAVRKVLSPFTTHGNLIDT